MRGVWLHDEPSGKCKNLSDFNDVLKLSLYLKQLSLPYIGNNEILRTVLFHCPKLNNLDVSGSSEITDKGVEKM